MYLRHSNTLKSKIHLSGLLWRDARCRIQIIRDNPYDTPHDKSTGIQSNEYSLGP